MPKFPSYKTEKKTLNLVAMLKHVSIFCNFLHCGNIYIWESQEVFEKLVQFQLTLGILRHMSPFIGKLTNRLQEDYNFISSFSFFISFFFFWFFFPEFLPLSQFLKMENLEIYLSNANLHINCKRKKNAKRKGPP